MPERISRGNALSLEGIDVALFFDGSSARRNVLSQRRFLGLLAVLAEQRHRTDEQCGTRYRRPRG